MSVHYIAMVRQAPECEECNGTGGLGAWDDENGGCLTCNGTGYGPERLGLHRVGRDRRAVLYDEPGKASGSVKRAATRRLRDEEPASIVLKVDTDECEPVESKMPLDEKIGHAETRMLYWTGRHQRLLEQAGERPRQPAEDFDAEDWCMLSSILWDFVEGRTLDPDERRCGQRILEIVNGKILRLLGNDVMIDVGGRRAISDRPPWCANCGDSFYAPERDCPKPAPGRPLVHCGRGGHMFSVTKARP